MKLETALTEYTLLDGKELAERWKVTHGWVRKQCSPAVDDPIPCIRLGRYVRFAWGSPDLSKWLERRYQH